MIIIKFLDALDFLRKTLEFNPNDRITVDDALKHPFLKEFRNTDEVYKNSKLYKVK